MILSSKKNNVNSSSKSITDYSRDSIKKMAVLFTDIVGSSKYFKKHGDIEGRRMLKTHQNLASPPINEFGGAVVKMLGDSVMAYFLNPEDALKSAIKIQQKFQTYNEDKKNKREIHIRLCVHYGDGIIDDNDIFGDVVNMAAKFLPLASGDEILISKELHQTLKESPFVKFENFAIPAKSNNVIKGLNLLKVVWDSRIKLDPTLKTLIHLRPVFNLGKKRFENIWNKLISEKKIFWSANTVEKEQINNDRSISLIVKKTPTAMEIAKHIISYLQTNMGHEADIYLPIQIIIDTGAFISAGKITLQNLTVSWNQIELGEIYASENTCHLLNKEGGLNISTKNNSTGSFYKISNNRKNQDNDNVFRYQNALIHGDFTPCFYCGSRSHDTMGCPSKMLTELTGYIEKLGYMTLENINNHFFHYLQASQSELSNIDTMSKSSPIFTAHQAFFELTSVFQLRLLRTIWNIKEDNWNRIKINKDEREKGGRLWIGFDCLRVSNIPQLKSIIQDELDRESKDYKAYCLAGLMYIENKQFRPATSILKKALDMAIQSPEKVYILFLLFRVYSLTDNTSKSRETLRKIITLSPHCTEAAYQDIVFKFHHGNRTSALDHLIKLIRKNRDYYIISQIDPELINYNKKISAKLHDLFMDAREKAEKIMPEAKNEVASLEKIMDKGSEEIIEANSQITKMDRLFKSNSYFGYLDIIHYSEYIFNLGKRFIKGREMRIYKIEMDLTQKIQRCKNYIDLLPYGFMVKPASFRIKSIQRIIAGIREKIKFEGIKEFKKTLETLNNFSKELKTLENKLRRMDALAQFLMFLAKFFKKNLIFQSINLVIALILLPILIHYLNFIIPDLTLSTSGIWHYQKVLIILGGIISIILSSITSQSANNPMK